MRPSLNAGSLIAEMDYALKSPRRRGLEGIDGKGAAP